MSRLIYIPWTLLLVDRQANAKLAEVCFLYFLFIYVCLCEPCNTVDKLNKSKLSGLENVFTMVLPLVHWWWWWWCCLFLRKFKTVGQSTMQVVAAVAAAVTTAAVKTAADDEEGIQRW